MRWNKKLWSVLKLTDAVALSLLFAGCAAFVGRTQAETTAKHSTAVSQTVAVATDAVTETESKAVPVSSPLMNNTTWTTDDGSEVVFTEDRINWYQSPENHDDNYYSGKYQFYVGQDAVRYITENLSEYGVTKQELEAQFKRSGEYDESCFVVFDIRYDCFMLYGKEQEIERPLVPWYGFLLKDGTFLDVANMNTGTYYPFVKQTK